MAFCCTAPPPDPAAIEELAAPAVSARDEETEPGLPPAQEAAPAAEEPPAPDGDGAGAPVEEPAAENGAPAPEPEKVPKRPADAPPVYIVIVNPKSGGNSAGEFLALPKEGFRVEEGGQVKAVVYSYAITDPDRAGFLHLAREVEEIAEPARARCIVAGGDGTVMWTIEEIFKAGIAVQRVSIGTVPFGTGNDFANVTGWGTKGPPKGYLREKEGFRGLKAYVARWLKAETRPYDIWEVSVKTREGGCFKFVEDGKKVCTEKHVARHRVREAQGGGLEMSKYMCNYFSLGLDARIGVGFDKNRQGSQVANKAVYGWEGTKKLLFKRKGLIANIMDSMRILPESIEKADEGHAAGAGEWVFTTGQGGSAEQPRLLGNPVNLIFLNIPSIAGGLNIWNWSRGNMGVEGGRDLLKEKQDFADGKLECLAYRSGIGYVLEQLRAPPISGRGHRVYSGGGPLRLQFRDPKDREYLKGTAHCKGRTYMEVDGEFFIVHSPDTIVVRHHCAIQILQAAA